MILFVKLFLAHIIGDFILQPKHWVEDKEQNKAKSKYLYLHVLLHFVLILVLVFDLKFFLCALLIAISHGLIDLLKLNFQKKETKRNYFIYDQLSHLAIIIIIGVSWLYYNGSINFENKSMFQFENSVVLFITSILFITKPTSIIIKNIISIWTPEKDNEKENDSLQNAGNYIGILERLFVLYFVINGNLEAIGFLLAAKSIFRFGDLKEAKDRKLTEYVLIGTLLSFGIAFLTGLIVNYLIQFI